MKRALGVAIAVVALATAGNARSDDGETSPRAAAKAAFDRAEQAARELHFQAALDAYEEAASRDPTAPFAPVSRARADDLRAHAEDNFGPLAELEAVRRDPQKNRDAAAIATLERDARAFPEGRVRSEALLVVAQAYAHTLDAPDRAAAALEVILSDRAADRGTRALALSEVITIYGKSGDLRAAERAVERQPDLLPNLTREVRAGVRRERGAKVCFGALAMLVLGAVWGGIRAVKRLRDVRALGPLVLPPRAFAFAFYVGAGGAIFVRLHGSEGDPTPFLGLGLGIVVVSSLVRLWGLGAAKPSRLGVAIRAGAGVIGMLAVAYLILWRASAASLGPLGL